MDEDIKLIKKNDNTYNNNYLNKKINEMEKNNYNNGKDLINQLNNSNISLMSNCSNENNESSFSIKNTKCGIKEQNRKMVNEKQIIINTSLSNNINCKTSLKKNTIFNVEKNKNNKNIVYSSLNTNNKNSEYSSDLERISYDKNNNSGTVSLGNYTICEGYDKDLVKTSMHINRDNSSLKNCNKKNISSGLINLDKIQSVRYNNNNKHNSHNNNNNKHNNPNNNHNHNNYNLMNNKNNSNNNICYGTLTDNLSNYYPLSDYRKNKNDFNFIHTKNKVNNDKYFIINSKNYYDNKLYNQSANKQDIFIKLNNNIENFRDSNIKKNIVMHGRTKSKNNRNDYCWKIMNELENKKFNINYDNIDNINYNKNHNTPIKSNLYHINNNDSHNKDNINYIKNYDINYNKFNTPYITNSNSNIAIAKYRNNYNIIYKQDALNYNKDNITYKKKNVYNDQNIDNVQKNINYNSFKNNLNILKKNEDNNNFVMDKKKEQINLHSKNDYKIKDKKLNELNICYKQESGNESNFSDPIKSDLFKTTQYDELDKTNIIKIIPNNNNNNLEEKKKGENVENENSNNIKSIDDLHNFLNAVNEYESLNKKKVKTVYIQDDANMPRKCKINYYQKRGSFNYSGLLTSMVSSILTQQNDIKIEESKCFDSSWNDNKYEYTLLHQIVETEKKDKIVSNKMEDLQEKSSFDKLLYLTLTLMICISILCNYDHGAIPVTLEEIQKDFPLSYIEQSLLGSLVYFGLIIGTIIASVLFELLSAKLLVTISIILLSISLYIFSHANCIAFMYISRFVNGLCQAIPVVYLPVWVDQFSPDEKATQWMSYIQLASIGGTVFGYFLGGILSNNNNSHHQNDSIFSNLSLFTTWRSPFLIQAFLLLPIFLIMIFVPSDKINITSSNSDVDKSNENNSGEYIYDKESSHNNQSSKMDYSFKNISNFTDKQKYKRSRSLYESKNSTVRMNFNRSATYIMGKKTNVLKKTFKEVKKLLKNRLYIIITLGMSNLYFVVTGIQFWITEYMSVVLLTEKIKIVTVSTLCFLTSPTSGVWFGGFVCDLFGGYKNTNYSKTIKVATAFAISACIFGILSAHLNNFILFSISLWLCLFTGSALVPVAVGMLLSCVDNHQKSLSSAVSQVIYNVFGWFSAPLLSGIIMDIMHKYTNDNRLALKTGFTMILYSSSIGFLLLLYANFLDFSDKKENDELLELEEPLK
ncbi:sugar transporter, putative [Plasmodium relictum]|uniref:Sugar transporter, putative n=1 Tax=Plasmodium relictum TaxID=85471 RepID=A0A1J1H704_PLARL|nr:sugar transporter, putative [Plasmodium relictum]CRG99371.1 sugar transporter, putative [Plasmodium relictum]